MRLEPGGAYRLDRRRFFHAAAGTAAAASATGALAWPARSAAHGGGGGDEDLTSPPPKPIPGGSQIPNGPFIHVFAPGDPTITLPFTGIPLEGLDVEPSTLTDFRGFSAVAFHVGTATGSDGRTYNFETDMRAFRGAYVDSAGMRRFGNFALI
jgi:hypothetical protein